jgi:hypothetical protein
VTVAAASEHAGPERVIPFGPCGASSAFDDLRILMSRVVGEQVDAHMQIPKRGLKGSRTPPLTSANTMEVQGDLDGRIRTVGGA